MLPRTRPRSDLQAVAQQLEDDFQVQECLAREHPQV